MPRQLPRAGCPVLPCRMCRRRPSAFRRIASALTACLLGLSLLGCAPEVTPETPTDYGTAGASLARSLAAAHPFRKAWGPGEQAAGDWILAELRKMGFEPEIVSFEAPVAEDGQEESENASSPTPAEAPVRRSRNLVVRIGGTGFLVPDGSPSPTAGAGEPEWIPERRWVLVGAHYDTALGTEADREAAPGFNGIQDNAAGVAAVLVMARELLERQPGYDVVIVFFGAGEDGQTGARHFAASLDAGELASLDAVYTVDGLYAGDRLYAHSGWNSTAAGKKYDMRRKLYEMTDVAIQGKIDLRTNQADLDVDLDGDGVTEVYREVTLRESDYRPFDQLGIPCVHMDSGDYFIESVGDFAESRNPAFAATGGYISGTASDDFRLLEPLLEEGRLLKRVNTAAFLLVGAIEKGLAGAVRPPTPTPAPTGR